ncbi:unnamed protein product [Lathyrus oleraceus]
MMVTPLRQKDEDGSEDLPEKTPMSCKMKYVSLACWALDSRTVIGHVELLSLLRDLLQWSLGLGLAMKCMLDAWTML